MKITAATVKSKPNVGGEAGGSNEAKAGDDSEECARGTTNKRSLIDVAEGPVSVA